MHEEGPMSDIVARSHFTYARLLSTHFKAVCLLSLLGLALAAALIFQISSER
jgi:hypothetical protein